MNNSHYYIIILSMKNNRDVTWHLININRLYTVIIVINNHIQSYGEK